MPPEEFSEPRDGVRDLVSYLLKALWRKHDDSPVYFFE